MLIKNIESKIKLTFGIAIGCFITCIAIVLLVMNWSYNLIANERQKIYVLDHNIPILVRQTTLDVNLEVEAKSHVNLFHMLFFTLPPDNTFIQRNIERSMYLIDESGLRQYNSLRERGFFHNLVATTSSASIMPDSIVMDMNDLSFMFYGTQRIERPSSILTRKLVTTGNLMQVPRTANNPHGLVITNWRTLLNQDLELQQRRGF